MGNCVTGSRPSSQRRSLPSAPQGSGPSSQQGSLPSALQDSQQGSVPSALQDSQQGSRPSTQQGSLPPAPQGSLSSARQGSLPPAPQGSIYTSQQSPWADNLHINIFSIIMSKCTKSAYRCVSYRLVSRDWCRLTDYTPHPPLPSPQIPFLLIPCRSAHLTRPLGYALSLPLLNHHQHPMTCLLPQLAQTRGGRICVGSSHGWIITLGVDSSMFLLNPVTRESFNLPSLSSINNTVLSFNPRSSQYRLPQKGSSFSQASMIRRAVVSSDPVSDGGFTVLLFISGLTTCCYMCTKESITWSQYLHVNFLVEDVIFFNGVFVAVDLSLNFVIFDFTKMYTGLVKKQLHGIYRLFQHELFLVEAAGKLLLVVKLVNLNRQRHLKGGFLVFEIIMPDIQAVRVESLSQCSLFIGHGCSVRVSRLHFPWLPEGKVYFPHFHTRQGNDEAAVYESVVGTITIQKVFDVENPKVAANDRKFAYSRFFWVTPNLNRR